MPWELLDNTTRVIPGDGISPLSRILRKLAAKGYTGPLSVELFLPKFQQGDPFEVARKSARKPNRSCAGLACCVGRSQSRKMRYDSADQKGHDTRRHRSVASGADRVNLGRIAKSSRKRRDRMSHMECKAKLATAFYALAFLVGASARSRRKSYPVLFLTAWCFNKV